MLGLDVARWGWTWKARLPVAARPDHQVVGPPAFSSLFETHVFWRGDDRLEAYPTILFIGGQGVFGLRRGDLPGAASGTSVWRRLFELGLRTIWGLDALVR